MEAETTTKTGSGTEQSTQEQSREIPLSKLRDLRPEKDPMGAGRKRSANVAADHSIR